MATFERIRKVSPYFFVVFAVLLIAYFVWTSGAEDVMKSQMGDPKTAKIGIINGEPILYLDFEKRVKDAIDIQRRQQKQQKQQEQEVDETQIRGQVWDEIVEEVLIRQESEKAGIKISNDEILDILIENPPDALKKSFSDTAGNFNRQVYLDLVTNPDNIVKYMGKNPTQIPQEEKDKSIAQFRNDLITIEKGILQQKYGEAIGTIVNSYCSVVSPEFAKLAYTADNTKMTINYIPLMVRDVASKDIKVTDEEIAQYYDKHKQNYKQLKAQRKIKYVSFPIEPSKDDTIRSQKMIEKISAAIQVSGGDLQAKSKKFDELLNEFYGNTIDFTLVKDIEPTIANLIIALQEQEVIGPIKLPQGTYFLRLDTRREGENEVVKASHILIKSGENKDSSLAKAKELLNEVRSGKVFAELASANSEDKASAASGGDLGFFGKGKMVPQFDSAVFAKSAKPGDIIGPVETQFGYHIIHIVEKKSDELKYSEIQIIPKISNVTRNMLKRDAFSIKEQVEKLKIPFDTIATRLRKRISESGFFDKTRPVLGSKYVTDLTFQAKVGEVLEPMELKNFGYVAIQVSDDRAKGIKPLADVKKDITAKIIVLKKLDILKAKSQELFKKIQQFGTLDRAFKADPQQFPMQTATDIKDNGVITGLGQEVAFTTTASKLPLGKISEPIRGEHGYYIIEVLSREVPDKAKISGSLSQFIETLRGQARSRAFENWFIKLKDEADIQDMRSKFFREY
ncbi:MAG: Peptidylprolyl isomerase [Ignavibacteria bacterium]|nr:Peptidylprolyl isomerase [Ignavibacteria bacterium]